MSAGSRLAALRERWPLALGLYLAMILVLTLAGIALRVSLGSSSGREGRFTILQVNDLYKIEGIERGRIGGLARVRALRKAMEAEGQPVLTLHGGDFLYPSVMSKYMAAEPMVQALNLLDGNESAFDDRLVVTFGNHEFDKPHASLAPRTKELLLARIAESDFRWVTSNILFRWNDNGPSESLSRRLGNVKDDLLIDLEGIRVGIFGITVPGSDHPWVNYRYEDRHRLAGEAIQRLKSQGAQVLIALTHQDWDEDVRLAEKFPEIHLIVGGHDHSFMQGRTGRTWITKADADARSVVRIDAEVLGDGRVFVVPQKIELGPEEEEDARMRDEVQRSRKKLAGIYQAVNSGKSLDQPIGTAPVFLEGVETAVRGRETALGNVLVDTIRKAAETRVAFLNGGAIRLNDNIPAKGNVTREDLEGILYFPNQIVSFQLESREDLLGLLRSSVSRVRQADGRFLQVSGLKFRYHIDRSTRPPSYRVDMDDVWVCPRADLGVPLDEYVPLAKAELPITVSTIKYLWEKGEGEGYALFAPSVRPKLKEENGIDWAPLVEQALRDGAARGVEERIVRVN